MARRESHNGLLRATAIATGGGGQPGLGPSNVSPQSASLEKAPLQVTFFKKRGICFTLHAKGYKEDYVFGNTEIPVIQFQAGTKEGWRGEGHSRQEPCSRMRGQGESEALPLRTEGLAKARRPGPHPPGRFLSASNPIPSWNEAQLLGSWLC